MSRSLKYVGRVLAPIFQRESDGCEHPSYAHNPSEVPQ